MNNTISNNIEGLNDLLYEQMKEWKIPGMAVGIIKNGEIIYSGELGLRNVNKNLNVTKDTLFAIGSASKAFTSLSIGILVDEGKLDLDTPIKKYMPSFEMHNKYAEEHLTLRDMLCHRSGLPRHDLLWYNNFSLSRKELVDRIKYLEFNKDFRETWQYNNLMYATAGYIIELVTGMTWEEFVKSRILEPLGMNSTNFSVDISNKSADYSEPYAEKEEEIHQINFRKMDSIGPAGSINSNLTDMLKWLSLHLNKGKVNGNQIISEKTISELHSPQIPCELFPLNLDELQFSSYGLGWSIESYRGRKHVNHGGNIDGFCSYTSFLPDENIGVVILTNLNNPVCAMPMAYYIYDKLLGYDYTAFNKKLKNEAKKIFKAMEAANKSIRNSKEENLTPSHSLEEYTGIYENPGYGSVKIEIKDNSLKLTHSNIEYTLTHKCYDVFTMTMMEYYLITVTFNYDSNGNIKSVSIPFEQTVKDILFIKQ
ncbi:serine hydrolase [Clostridium chromiireducens]|uniref:Serine hydrolase n=1 Tax=Clostridium chromiireducens TaxID=225345 RepID=A0A964RS16_9CLOT|nr:serine hydrolase [Clostridium chromiireducens]MVX66751.1 serine hydrolase [Clostridium chromiireducens]